MFPLASGLLTHGRSRDFLQYPTWPLPHPWSTGCVPVAVQIYRRSQSPHKGCRLALTSKLIIREPRLVKAWDSNFRSRVPRIISASRRMLHWFQSRGSFSSKGREKKITLASRPVPLQNKGRNYREKEREWNLFNLQACRATARLLYLRN